MTTPSLALNRARYPATSASLSWPGSNVTLGMSYRVTNASIAATSGGASDETVRATQNDSRDGRAGNNTDRLTFAASAYTHASTSGRGTGLRVRRGDG